MNLKGKELGRQKERMIHIRLKGDIHRLLRVRVAEEDATIQEWVTSLIEHVLKDSIEGRNGERHGN